MRKLALLLTLLMAASAPTLAFAKKAKRVKAPPPQTVETLNKDSIKMFHDMFFWPSK